jgi:hypothetical protein
MGARASDGSLRGAPGVSGCGSDRHFLHGDSHEQGPKPRRAYGSCRQQSALRSAPVKPGAFGVVRLRGARHATELSHAAQGWDSLLPAGVLGPRPVGLQQSAELLAQRLDRIQTALLLDA